MSTARSEYLARQARIQDLIQQLQKSMTSHNTKAAGKPRDWGYTGDLAHAEARLQELVDFFQY